MSKNLDVCIVSAFGRGNWLASELTDNGSNVGLVDVSAELGRWTPEDWEGPFGFFRSEKIKASQIGRLHEEDYEDPVHEGFSLWLKSGPIDFKGPLSNFLLEKSGADKESLRYLSSFESMNDGERSKLQSHLSGKKFSEGWLVHLAHQLASPVDSCGSDSVLYGRPLPVFAPYFVRRVSRRGADRCADWLKEKGVVIFDDAKIQDISIEKSQVQSLEVLSERSGGVRAKVYLWLLSSEETSKFTSVSKALFPNGPLLSKWSWIRYRLQLDEIPAMTGWPDKFFMIDELELPWTHSNMVAVQKSVSSGSWDCWIKIPSQHRFRRSYLEEMGQKILGLFDSRVKIPNGSIQDMPQEYIYDDLELGPSRFPVYCLDELKRLSTLSLSNLFYGGPERWPSLDWSGQFSYQEKLFDEVFDWQTKMTLKEKKEEKEE